MVTSLARPILLILTFVGLLAVPLVGGDGEEPRRRRGDFWCGADDTLLEQVIARHLHNREFDRTSAPARAGLFGHKAEVRKEGNIAVAIDNSARMIRPSNPVDLEGSSLQFRFRKRKGGYAVKRGGSFSDTIGDRLPLGESDSIKIDLPFKVKVFGQRYDAVYVNDDGNLTFGRPDSVAPTRRLTTLLTGPPRLAPFLADLDPDDDEAGGGVFALIGPKSLRVTWVDVPEFAIPGEPNALLNTFQVTISRNGKVTFSYRDLDLSDAVVGLAPGGGSTLELLDYSEQLPAAPRPAAIAEDFTSSTAVDEAAIARIFLENFADRYMSLAVFTDFGVLLPGRGFAQSSYTLNVKNDIRGIGEARFDASRAFGSSGALEAFVMMGPVDNYSAEIEERNLGGGVYSPLDVLMHNIGHRWGARLRFDDGGQVRDDMLTSDRIHWSYCFNSERSYLGGNGWLVDDDGDGLYQSVDEPPSYSDFDLYAMGLIGPESVAPSFLIDGDCNPDRRPALDSAASGPRTDIDIADVVAALGERRPAFPDAPREFEIAFLLLVEAGEEPRAESLAKVDALRRGAMERMAAQGGKLITRLRVKR